MPLIVVAAPLMRWRQGDLAAPSLRATFVWGASPAPGFASAVDSRIVAVQARAPRRGEGCLLAASVSSHRQNGSYGQLASAPGRTP